MKRILLLFLLPVLLAACQSSNANVPVTGDFLLTGQPQTSPTPFPSPLPSPTATATPIPAADQAQKLAETAAGDYFAALQKGDVNAAANQVSTFSLEAFNMTVNDAAGALNTQRSAGAAWANLQVLDSQTFDAQTILVHVRYSLTANQVTQTQDELWPFRLEMGAWRYNWKNLIDFRTLTISPQTTAGVTVLPTQLRRFTDHLDLLMLMQNRTNEPVVFGQVNEILATFHFRDQSVQAEQNRIILYALRSIPDATITVRGLFLEYPNSVTIRQWKNYNVKPWYTFNLE